MSRPTKSCFLNLTVSLPVKPVSPPFSPPPLPKPSEPVPTDTTIISYPSLTPQLLTSPEPSAWDSDIQATTVLEETPDSFILPGYTEPTSSELQLETLLSDATPAPILPFDSIPIHTYQGKTLIQPTLHRSDLPSSSRVKPSPEPDPTWSRGLGLELSPLKTRSACKKTLTGPSTSGTSSTVTNQGALRGLKALASR
jgi:hypothetical protein